MIELHEENAEFAEYLNLIFNRMHKPTLKQFKTSLYTLRADVYAPLQRITLPVGQGSLTITKNEGSMKFEIFVNK
jgi:hypothetical protein